MAKPGKEPSQKTLIEFETKIFKFSKHYIMEATKEDKPKRESTQEYLKSLGLGGNSKRQQKRAAADAEERKKKDFTADVVSFQFFPLFLFLFFSLFVLL